MAVSPDQKIVEQVRNLQKDVEIIFKRLDVRKDSVLNIKPSSYESAVHDHSEDHQMSHINEESCVVGKPIKR